MIYKLIIEIETTSSSPLEVYPVDDLPAFLFMTLTYATLLTTMHNIYISTNTYMPRTRTHGWTGLIASITFMLTCLLATRLHSTACLLSVFFGRLFCFCILSFYIPEVCVQTFTLFLLTSMYSLTLKKPYSYIHTFIYIFIYIYTCVYV